MFILNQIFKLLKLIHSEVSTHQISAGFVAGMFLGFTPMMTLHWFLYWVVLFLFRFNLGAAFLAYAAFKVLALGLDPVFHKIGLWLLAGMPSLLPLWVKMYTTPIVPYTRFNNTTVSGSFWFSVVWALPLFVFSGVFLRRYRETVVARFKTTWLFRVWSTSKLYALYGKYEQYKPTL